MTRQLTVNYSCDGNSPMSVTVDKNCKVADFINKVRSQIIIFGNQQIHAYFKGRKLDDNEFILNCVDDISRDVLQILCNFDIYQIELPFKRDNISTEETNLLIEDLTSDSDEVFKIYTTATKNSIIRGHSLLLNKKDNYTTVEHKIKELIRGLDVPEIPKKFDIQIYLPCGVPFLPSDDPENTKLFKIFNFVSNLHHVLYVVITMELGEFIDQEIKDPCNCFHFNKYMLSPLFESTTAGLTQIASFLGYIYHNGIHSYRLIEKFAIVTGFPPLIVNLFRLLENDELNVRNIVAITAPLLTYFSSYLPEVEKEKVFEYLIIFITFIFLLEASDKIDIKTFDLKKYYNNFYDDYEDEKICDYLRYTNQQDHVIMWMKDINDKQFSVLDINPPNEGVLTKYIYEIVNCFQPTPPYRLPYIYYPTFIKGPNENEVLLYLNMNYDNKNKKLFINYIDPKIGELKQSPFDSFISEYENEENCKTENEKDEIIDSQIVDQIIVFCLDVSNSMHLNLKGDKVKEGEISRSKIAAQFIQEYMNQLAINRNSSVFLLISFGSEIQKYKGLFAYSTEDYEDFGKNIDPVDKTLLYDAINESEGLINFFNIFEYEEEEEEEKEGIIYPNAKTRIIVISDGEDNQSTISPIEILKNLIEKEIIVDSIILSEKVDENVKKLSTFSKMTGGLSFQITDSKYDIKNLIKQDAFVDITKRYYTPSYNGPITHSILKNKISEFKGFDKQAINKEIIKSRSSFPLATPLYMKLLYRDKFENYRIYRALKELEFIMLNPSDNFVVYSSVATPDEWRIFIKGPDSTPFENKWLSCFIILPFLWPIKPPTFIFVTVPFHPNVSNEGKILFDLIDSKYKPELSISVLIEGIIEMLENPNENEVLNFEANELFITDKDEFLKRQCTGETGTFNYHEYLDEVKVYFKINNY